LPVEPLEVSFETSIPLVEARDRILAALAERNGNIKVNYPTEILVKLGSGAKTRFLGGMWIDKQNFPRDVMVSLRESGGSSHVKITVRDSLGMGSRAGMSDKYRQVMYEDAMVIRSQFQDAR
jgi:hypothetical protein